jgi:methylated-DNA-[protein]-cysteine S-methyltransferase
MASWFHCKGVLTMGQSGQRFKKSPLPVDARLEASVFSTEFGWFAVAGRRGAVCRIVLGHSTADEALWEILRSGPFAEAPTSVDWHPQLRQRLEAYCAGARVSFDDVALEQPPASRFRQKVLLHTRRIPFGKTLTYAELAASAGFPGAARAVGSVMSSNLFPIVVPCHRVVASGGKLGGYSAPQGVQLKRRLLALEREALHVPWPAAS